ncbi:MAG: saccharopine dehydrogenase [Alphaproteobacteria bacterium]|nr:saccharopine dehydrogenase [Alphaproteobacteria bacterium]
MRPVLILGGYGNFGKRIAQALTKSKVPVIIAGRSREKANALKQELGPRFLDTACFNAFTELDEELKKLNPSVVINTCGPFQNSNYSIAESCIGHGVHYIDLADGRNFVTGIVTLDQAARQNKVVIISGASTVPGLSSAVLENFRHEFSRIDSMTFGISPGQKAERGLATTQSILSYVGKPLKPFSGQGSVAYGWQDLYRQEYPEIGKRWMANCDVPDLDLLPKHYGVGSIRFSAGLEISVLHIGLWGLSWLVRAGVPLNLPHLAAPLLKVSNWFNGMGSADGGMHVIITGRDRDGRPHSRTWFIIAFDGDGPYIPTIPAVILAKRLAQQRMSLVGAMPCVGMVPLDDYLAELRDFNIQTYSA